MKDIAFLPAKKLSGLVRRKKIGCVELLDHILDRMARYNPVLNAIVATDIPTAKKRAKAADTALAQGEVWGPLHGVPMTVKDSFDVAGLPSTWGYPPLADNVPNENALAVARWLKAGVTIFGKTNVPLFLADSQSFNEIYGRTNNPWDLTRTPGGSSGGASAALAAGMTGIEMGSDIASSVRNPAAYCGLFAHKPTYGICPPRGHSADGDKVGNDIAVIGPLGRSAGDIALGLSIIAGPDEIDARGIKLSLPAAKQKTLRDFKIAIIHDDAIAPVDDTVIALSQRLAAFLRDTGAVVNEDARPDITMAEVSRTYDILLRAATSARMPDDLQAQYREQAARLDPKDDSKHARMLHGNTLSHRDWLRLNEYRHRMRWKWHEFFEDYDLLLCPVNCTAAFPHDSTPPYERTIIVNNSEYPFHNHTFWAGYTCMTYLPATVAPMGFTEPEGLPMGVQIVGPQYGDRSCLKFAELLEREYQAFTPPPGYD